jgi:hypothetical protein
MAETAARTGVLSLTGTSTLIEDEALTEVSSLVWQFDSGHLLGPVDPAYEVLIDDGGTVPSGIDYAQGLITFSVAPTDPEITCHYLPLLPLAAVRSVSVVGPHRTFVDSTRIGDTSKRQLAAAYECRLTLELMESLATIIYGSTTLEQIISGTLGDQFFVELLCDTRRLRGWFATTKESAKHDLESVLIHALELEGVVQTPVTIVSAADQALFSEVTDPT